MEFLNNPPPIRRLNPQDPGTAREAGSPAPGAPVNGNGAASQGGGFTAARRKVAAPAFSIRRMEVDEVSVNYGPKEAVKAVSLPIRQGEVLALIGPSAAARRRSCARSTASPS